MGVTSGHQKPVNTGGFHRFAQFGEPFGSVFGAGGDIEILKHGTLCVLGVSDFLRVLVETAG